MTRHSDADRDPQGTGRRPPKRRAPGQRGKSAPGQRHKPKDHPPRAATRPPPKRHTTTSGVRKRKGPPFDKHSTDPGKYYPRSITHDTPLHRKHKGEGTLP